MAVDPATGQTIIPIQGGASLAGFMDPTMFGQVQAGQGQNDLQAALAQRMMGQGYIPNSGIGGALTQVASALMGMKMLNDSKANSEQLYQKYAQAMADAEAKKHTQEQGDKDADVTRAINKDVGIASGNKNFDFQNQDKEAALKGATAKAESDAQQPNALAKISAEGKNSANAAYIGATAGQQQKVAQMKAAGATPEQIAAALVGPEAYQLGSGGPSKQDKTAIDKRIPALQDQVSKVDTALQLANDMKNKLQNNQYDLGGLRGGINAYAPTYFQSKGGQELQTDAGNLILQAQGALQSQGSRGSVAQLRVLQTSKPNTSLSPEANINAIDSIIGELQKTRQNPAAELEHYGNGGTPTSWAQVSSKAMAAPKKSEAPPEGSRVRGPDGKIYVVKDGQPVPE